MRRGCGEERSEEELGAWRACTLGLLVAREWLFRRAGDSGCELVTLDAESFPDCPPGSLPRPSGTVGRAYYDRKIAEGMTGKAALRS